MTHPEVKPTIPAARAAAEAAAGRGAAAAGAGGVGGYFTQGNIGEQLVAYSVLGQVIGGLLSAPITKLVQSENQDFPLTPLSGEQAAVAAVREIIDQGQGAAEALKSGIDGETFGRLIELAQTPPALGLILEAARRSLAGGAAAGNPGIDLDKALADLGISEQYRPMVKSMVVSLPTAEDALQALLEGQISRDESYSRYVQAGGDPTWFESAFNTRGQAPTPVQALEMLNRGLIAESGDGPESTSWHQAFLEGPWRNKWAPAFLGLRHYVTPPRSVVAQLRSGAIDNARAIELFARSGVDEATAAEFIAEASHHATAAQRTLSMTQIVDLYESHLIDHAEAINNLTALKYTVHDANLLLSLADVRVATASIKSATSRLRSLYLAGANDAAATRAGLSGLGVFDANVTQLLAVWDLEKVSATRTLSEAQIVAAFYHQLLDQPAAMSRLTTMGYSAHDAWLLLSTRTGEPLPNEPGQ